MKLEDQVCSLESAKKLKELGMPQDSLWYWTELDKESNEYTLIFSEDNTPPKSIGNVYSAFTCAELGERLEKESINCVYYHDKYICITFKRMRDIEIRHINLHLELERTEANARATLLKYLIENKLINL